MQKRRAYVLSVLLGSGLLWSLFSCSIAKQTQTPQSTATVVQSQASPTARSIAVGTLLYQANWSKGLDGWKGGVNALALRQPELPPPGFAQVAGFQQIDYVPGTNWRVYRIEVRGNEVSLSIDGATVSSVSSREKVLSTGQLGLRSEGFELHISSYRITVL